MIASSIATWALVAGAAALLIQAAGIAWLLWGSAQLGASRERREIADESETIDSMGKRWDRGSARSSSSRTPINAKGIPYARE